ncbi:MAG: DUF4435 domain-containing protein [Oscillospiraceae bacterium]|nr:DUF4435 domain-containing protein [Oscillospiraceae bacterium]
MSFLDVLNDSSESSAPAYHEFLQRYNPKRKQVFVFYEGDEDSSYYKFFLKKHITDDCEIEEIIAGCKNNVLKIQREFDWKQYNKLQIIFIVDRDLSYWLPDPDITEENVFVTDEYSVENYVVNVDSFEAWLTKFQGFARANKKEIIGMTDLFIRLLPSFSEAMIPIMAEAIIGKRKNRSIKLSDLSIKSVLQFELEHDNLKFRLNEQPNIRLKWGLTEDDDIEIQHQIEVIQANRHLYSVRGKWLIVFMAEMGEYMRKHANSFAPSLGKEMVKKTCAVESAQTMTVLAPYSQNNEPPRLKSFLDHTFSSYCEKELLPA